MPNKKYNAHTDPLFKSLKLLKNKDIVDVQCMKIRYKYVNNNEPTYFDSVFSLVMSIDSHLRESFQ